MAMGETRQVRGFQDLRQGKAHLSHPDMEVGVGATRLPGSSHYPPIATDLLQDLGQVKVRAGPPAEGRFHAHNPLIKSNEGALPVLLGNLPIAGPMEAFRALSNDPPPS